MARTLLFVLPGSFQGENRGIHAQHVASMQWLLGSGSGWEMRTADILDDDLDDAVTTADVVVVHMMSNPRVEGVIRRRRALALPTVFEFSDNFLGLGDWLPPRHSLRSPLVRQRVLYHAWLCDAVQVYAAPLARLFATVNRRIAVFDPYVPLAERPPDRRDGPFLFGWGGTSSHEQDLARIAPAIVDFCDRHPEAVFAYMGDRPVFERHFCALGPKQALVRGFGPYEHYLDFVRTWDAGLAPLGRDPFNNARTDTKFLTYAASGVAPLLEAHPVHDGHGATALLFEGPEGLTERLEWLHADRERVRALAGKAHAWARRERNAERLRDQRIAFYESLVCENRAAHAGGGGRDIAAAIDESPLARLRRSHRSWERRVDLFRAMLRQQPYDYVALRSVIAHCEANPCEEEELARLYERLSLLAPDAVPPQRRPAFLADFLPA